MSEIPFVNQLGDALDAAIANPARAPRRRGLRRLGRRRYLAVALAALAVTGGSAAVAGLFTDPVEIGFGAVGCFEQPSTDGNVAIISDPTRSPVELCAAKAFVEQGFAPRDLIACSWEGHGIVVIPHDGRRSCAAHELAPVPASYGAARRRAARLNADVKAFEESVGCVPPAEFAKRLTRTLRAAGWRGWDAVARGGEGPCGRVSPATGSELLGQIGPAVDAQRRTIAVTATPPLELEQLVYGADSPGARPYETSGERCFTAAALEQHVREIFEPAGVSIRFTVQPLEPGVSIADETGRAERYAEGCTVFAGASIQYPDGRAELLVELQRRD
jgi:hypothetical protein